MQSSIENIVPHDLDWQRLCQKLHATVTLSELVLTAWRMGLWLARAIVEQQLIERAHAPTQWGNCPVCGAPLSSKGFVKRQMLTLVGQIEWKRRVSRCPQRCPGSQSAPLDTLLGVDAYQQTSTELKRLGCLMAVFLPFELAARLLQQLVGIVVSDDTIWQWVQIAGEQAITQLETQLQQFANGKLPQPESLNPTVSAMPLVIAADGVTVPFRPHSQIHKGKSVWWEVKVAILARLGKHQTRTGEQTTRLHQRRLVAVLGDIDSLQPRLQSRCPTTGNQNC